MTISLIAAVTENGVIGRDNDLPWHLSTDLKRLKQLTMGHFLIMGRKTFESIGKPLPGRTIVVISHKPATRDDVLFASSIDEALALAANDNEPFIAGGSQVFEQSFPRADRLYLTRIHATIPGDAYFPEFDSTEWQLREREDHEADAKNDYPFSFLLYERSGVTRKATDEVSG
jgi:dihydrofolate reductase